MTIPDLFQRPTECFHCGERDRIITGDGHIVCRPCIYRFGHAAGDPESLTYGEARMLQEAHGDVLRLGYRPGPIEPDALGRHRTRMTLAWVWHDDLDITIQRRLDAIRGDA